MSASLRVGILGGGEFSAVHAEALSRRPDAELVAVASRTREGAKAFAERYGVRAMSESELIAADLDAIVVASPHANHRDHAIAVLNSGKHLMVEKPITMNGVEASDVVTAADRAEGICFVAHPQRFSRAYQRARELIEAGALGEVTHVSSSSVIPWRPELRKLWHFDVAQGGGMLLTQGVHVIERVSWILGTNALRVFGGAEIRYHDPSWHTADDAAWAALQFDGVSAFITLEGHSRTDVEVHTEVHGTGGRMRVSHRGDLVLHDGDGRVVVSTPSDAHWRDQMIGAEWEAFVASTASGTAAIDARHGAYVIDVADAIRASRSAETVQITPRKATAQ